MFQESKDKFKNNNDRYNKNSYRNNYKNYNNYNSKNFYNNSNYNKKHDNNNNREPFTRNSIKCNYCKREGHSETQCRIKMGLCLKCGGPNHLAKDCLQNKRRNFSNINRFNSYDRYINQNTTNNLKETEMQTASNDNEWENNYMTPTPEGGLTPLNIHAST